MVSQWQGFRCAVAEYQPCDHTLKICDHIAGPADYCPFRVTSQVRSIPKKAPTPVEPGLLTLLDEKPMTILPVPGLTNSTGRRTALAQWLTDPENPLTTRVIVNRVWQYHFGHGLSRTASDFGKLGEMPSHPELLDWMARRFVAEGGRSRSCTG